MCGLIVVAVQAGKDKLVEALLDPVVRIYLRFHFVAPSTPWGINVDQYGMSAGVRHRERFPKGMPVKFLPRYRGNATS